LKPSSIAIKATVSIGTRDEGGFGLKVDLEATVGGLPAAEAAKLIEAAHQVCPYSNAIRGNVEVGLTTTVVTA
jgi:organic hydroperoxide reductase OsmC/OhrA